VTCIYRFTALDVLDRELGPRLVTVTMLRKQSILHYVSGEAEKMKLIASRVLIVRMLQKANDGVPLTQNEVRVGVQDLYGTIQALQLYCDCAVFNRQGDLVFVTANFTGNQVPVQDLKFSGPLDIQFTRNSHEILLMSKVWNGTYQLGHLQCDIGADVFRGLVYEPAGLEGTGEVLVARPLKNGSMEFLVDPKLSPGLRVVPLSEGMNRVSVRRSFRLSAISAIGMATVRPER
jgi:hypothetical protein